MALTLKQENFARAVASGMSQIDAYREYYCVKPDTSDECVYVDSAKLAANPKVSLRIAKLRKEYGDQTQLTSRDKQLAILVETQETAMAYLKHKDNNGHTTINKGAADTIAKTSELISKMCGFNAPDKVDATADIRIIIDGDDGDLTG